MNVLVTNTMKKGIGHQRKEAGGDCAGGGEGRLILGVFGDYLLFFYCNSEWQSLYIPWTQIMRSCTFSFTLKINRRESSVTIGGVSVALCLWIAGTLVHAWPLDKEGYYMWGGFHSEQEPSRPEGKEIICHVSPSISAISSTCAS